MFQFRRFPTYAYLIQRTLTGYCPAGLPHSEISGSKDICSSPKLIAACHVLLRLLMPRHSPCALSSLTNRKLAFARSRCELCRPHRFRNCNRYPSSFQMLFHNLNLLAFRAFQHRNLSVALLHLQSHCSVFKVQNSPASFEARS